MGNASNAKEYEWPEITSMMLLEFEGATLTPDTRRAGAEGIG